MRPRTIAQRHVLKLSQGLPKITREQEEYAFRHAVAHEAYRLKNGRTGCLDCGHVWHEALELVSIIEIECPSCGIPLKVENTRRLNGKHRGFFGIVTVCEDYQVSRFYKLWTYHTVGKPAQKWIREVAQLWMHPDKKLEIVGENRNTMGYCDNFHGDMEIRNRDNLWKYNICPTAMWPTAQVLPIYKRNGIRNNFHGISPYNLLTGILHDSTMETLLKAKQYSLLSMRSDRDPRINRYWSAIKICMRNRYIVKDAKSWLDYLDLLERYGKDLRNAKFVCPKNFKREHDHYVAKYREQLRREEEERNRLNIEKQQQRAAKAAASYTKMRAAFFGICIVDDDLSITVLQNVEEFKAEGDAHKHCVYTNAYYKKKDSLIMSAQVNGVRIETIEMNLATLKVVQSRGLKNQATEYNARILSLLNRNLDQIRKAIAQSKRKKKTQQPANNTTQSCAA